MLPDADVDDDVTAAVDHEVPLAAIQIDIMSCIVSDQVQG
jgi:hypothetical protein